MAVLPPPAPAYTPPVLPPPARRSGCGCGCAGCLLTLLLVVVLVVGAGYFFLVVQAQAGVASPAALLVVKTPVDVGRNDSGYVPAVSGRQLTAGDSVRTGNGGHAQIQFPDGSLIRLSPGTTVTVTTAQLANDGNLKSATVQQKVGRTLSTVQHLVGGANFQVGGHSVSAGVRGTEFEVLVRPDGTNLIKVYDGTVTVSGATTATLTANQQIDVDANGRLGTTRSIQSEPQDPFTPQAQCAKAASAGTNPGTSQSSSGDNLTTGQDAQVGYDSAGGNLTVATCYAGSLMRATVTDPNGRSYSAQGPPPLFVKVPNGPPGHYTLTVHGVSLPPGGEPYSVTFATDAGCSDATIDTGGVVRHTISNAQLSQALVQSGITLQVQGTSPKSARLYYASNFGGFPITWTIDFYASTPNLGFVLTQITVRGINVTAQVVSRLTSVTGQSVSAIPTDYIVDRVYSCVGPGGNVMVIEGHR